MVAGSVPPAGRRDDAESRLRAGRDPEPPRVQAEPSDGAACGLYLWLARSERVNPARPTSTRRARRPGFRTVMTAVDAPRSVTRSGLALSPIPRPAAAPGMDAAAATRTPVASARLTGR
jgi:hypothetical protein